MALVLATVVTVVGAFGAENYKNSVMGINFETTENNAINLVLQTKTSYNNNITPIRKDANTFVLTLPETDSKASTPDLSKVSSNIESVNIRTMPYSNTAKGYTRITIKTLNPSLNLFATNQIYIANPVDNMNKKDYAETSQPTKPVEKETVQKKVITAKQQPKRLTASPINTQNTNSNLIENQNTVKTSKLKEVPIKETAPKVHSHKSDAYKKYLWLWALLILSCSAFFYLKAKDQIQEIAGENFEVDAFDKNKKEKREKKFNKIKKTIKKIDTLYNNTSLPSQINEYNKENLNATIKTAKPAEELNIVDLDELFVKQRETNNDFIEEENNDLEDFLSQFEFDEVDNNTPEENTGFDEEFYEKIINNNSLNFSKDDIYCINKLLNSEIDNNTIDDIKKYVTSVPEKNKVSSRKSLEDFVTGYAISQNILFSQEDIQILNNLINVEIDASFINDLRTNPQRTVEMEKDILAYGDKPKKPSEIITLNVKDMLPNLSDELKKHGNKKIESNRKPETVFFSEGYEVSKLSVSDSLPDLSTEINNKNVYISKPSASYEYVDTSYVVGTKELKIASELPDLQDALANPEKYITTEPAKKVVDEEALLKNIANVTFKPFYEDESSETANEIAPTISDIKDEMNQFAGFEISEEEIVTPVIENNHNSANSFYEEEFVDLDKQLNRIKSQSQLKNPIIENSKNIKKLSDDNIRQNVKPIKKEEEKRNKSVTDNAEEKQIKCILEGETYNIISSTAFSANKGCYLAKNEKGYIILGYIDNNLIKINEYESFKSEKIHARLNSQLTEETAQYLIRVGTHKLVINVSENSMEFVMDLC